MTAVHSNRCTINSRIYFCHQTSVISNKVIRWNKTIIPIQTIQALNISVYFPHFVSHPRIELLLRCVDYISTFTTTLCNN